jgi:hypothetical protein
MALIDDPKAYILRMFQMEAGEGRSSFCQVFPSGSQPDGLPLETGEMVYGIYKNKYVFTPVSLILQNSEAVQRLPWAHITACSTKHGCGEKQSVLTVSDGTTVVIELNELAKGWSGRISQLVHGMIERWGNRAALGPALLSVDEFVQRARDPYEFAPNLEPHPALETIGQLLRELRAAPEVHTVLLSPANAEKDDFAITSVVVTAEGRPNAVDEFARTLKASAVVEVTECARRNIGKPHAMRVWEILWD